MTAPKVPFFNYSRAFAADEAEYTARFRDILLRGAFILQGELVEFDRLKIVPGWLERGLARPAVQRGLTIPARI